METEHPRARPVLSAAPTVTEASLAALPESLARHVVRSADGFVFSAPRAHPAEWALLGIWTVLAGIALVMLSAMASLALLGVVAWAIGSASGPGLAALFVASFAGLGILGACGVTLLGSVGLWWMNRVTVHRGGIARRGWRSSVPRGPVRVHGAPGGPVAIDVGSTRLATFDLDAESPEWGWEAIGDLAALLGRTLDVPVNDERPHAAWSAWFASPIERRRVRLLVRVARSERAHPRWHGVAPRAPHVEHELHCQVTRIVGASGGPAWTRQAWHAEHLVAGGKRVPWAAILDARVRFEDGLTRRGILELLVHGHGAVIVVDARFDDPSVPAQLHWIAAEIAERARQATLPTERGRPDEVPDALRALVGGAQDPSTR